MQPNNRVRRIFFLVVFVHSRDTYAHPLAVELEGSMIYLISALHFTD
jgi:hypothetical protein